MKYIYIINIIKNDEFKYELSLIPKKYNNIEFIAKSPLEAFDLYKKYCKNSEIISDSNRYAIFRNINNTNVYEIFKNINIKFEISKRLLGNFNEITLSLKSEGNFKI